MLKGSMKLNALYLCLQKEVKCGDLNDFLYEKNISNVKKKEQAKEDINALVDLLLESKFNHEEVINKKGFRVKVQSLMNPHTHAMFNPNTKEILISPNWLQYLESKLDENTAYEFCLSHEVCHLLENDAWFASYRRRERRAMLEVVALMYSQRITNLNYHPSIFEFGYGLKHKLYTEEDLLIYLKGA